jgi:hypothetical protein
MKRQCKEGKQNFKKERKNGRKEGRRERKFYLTR